MRDRFCCAFRHKLPGSNTHREISLTPETLLLGPVAASLPQVQIALAGLGLQSLLIGHHEGTQTVHHGVKHVGENDTVTQQFLLPLCPWSRRTASVLTFGSGIPPSAPRTGQVAFTTSGG